VISCLGATANPEKKKPRHNKGKRNLLGKNVLFEFACSKDSNLGKVGQECRIKVIRLCKEDINLEDPQSIDQLASQVSALKGCSIHCSIECKPWSQWQHLNKAKHPRLLSRINEEQKASAALVEQFIRIANICLDNGGECNFEWPRFCSGWSLPLFATPHPKLYRQILCCQTSELTRNAIFVCYIHTPRICIHRA